jgi:Arc/MetJ family transcription regulator
MIIHMRTTIVIDDDIIISVKRIAASRGESKKKVINDLLRKGLERRKDDKGTALYETAGADLGACRYPHMDDISEVLAVAEGEEHK